jgi:hypothetical protein
LGFAVLPSRNGQTGSFELEIFLADNSFYLEKIPVMTVSNLQIADEVPFSSITTRRHGVQFGELLDYQISQLEYFIQNHTTGEVYVNHSLNAKTCQ